MRGGISYDSVLGKVRVIGSGTLNPKLHPVPLLLVNELSNASSKNHEPIFY